MSLSKRKNVIQVFEHQKLIIDEEKGFKHKHWQALSVYNEKYQNKYFTLLHNGIKFLNYVGVIQAGNITIEILPKIDKENLYSDNEKRKWHSILLQMLRQCRLLKIEHAEKASLQLKSNSILDIYLELFLNEVEILLHKGLIKKYRREFKNITALKGRIYFSKHISSNIIHKEKFFVQHTIYDGQNKYNQILNEALKLIPLLTTNASLINKLGKITLSFPELENLKITETTFEKIKYDRKSSHYKEALEIAKMILLNYQPDITGGSHNVIAILFDMNMLWEEYVFRKLQRASNYEIKVRRQQSQKFWKRHSAIYPKMVRPDIVITKGEEVFILDTKWKLIPDFTPADDDLKQMFVYNLYWKSGHSVLLYPSLTYQKEVGSYFQFHQQSAMSNHCSVATCNIFNERNFLDEEIGNKILAQLLAL